ncbi:hypothetical protein ES705_42993 [subsurface metagenome]
MTIIPGVTPCFRCIYPVLPDAGTLPTCETAGIVGTVPAVIGVLQATEAIKILAGADTNRGLITFDAWNSTFYKIETAPRKDCPACRGEYEFLNQRFGIKVTSFCGQSRALQLVNTELTEISLPKLAARLKELGEVSYDDLMLRFIIGDKEIITFPDGRVIVRNTIDEAEARELYARYVLDRINHGKHTIRESVKSTSLH